MFSVLAVSLASTIHRGGSYVTITHEALDLTVQKASIPDAPLQDSRTLDITVQAPLLVTSGDHHWRPIQTCSLQDPSPTGTDIWWLLKHVLSVQVGGTHPTGMLSCLMMKTLSVVLHVCKIIQEKYNFGQ